MIFREAKIDDIKQIQIVRNSVKENTLSNPDLITDQDCEEFLFQRGKGWVCEIDCWFCYRRFKKRQYLGTVSKS